MERPRLFLSTSTTCTFPTKPPSLLYTSDAGRSPLHSCHPTSSFASHCSSLSLSSVRWPHLSPSEPRSQATAHSTPSVLAHVVRMIATVTLSPRSTRLKWVPAETPTKTQTVVAKLQSRVPKEVLPSKLSM